MLNVWIGNLGKYNEGELVGEWLKLPVSKQELDTFLREKVGLQLTQTEVDKANLNKYLYTLYNGKYDFARTNLLIKKYVTELGFTYSGIHKALIYFYEVQGNAIEDEASRSIGIVPYVYEEAKNYYYKMWSVNKRNSEVNIENYIPKTINITNPQPQRKIKKPKKKFSFLDEEVDINGK